MGMCALAAKGRDTREVGQAYRRTPGKYAEHTEGLKAFIRRKGEKKGTKNLLPSLKNVYPHQANYLSRHYALAAQERETNGLVGF